MCVGERVEACELSVRVCACVHECVEERGQVSPVRGVCVCGGGDRRVCRGYVPEVAARLRCRPVAELWPLQLVPPVCPSSRLCPHPAASWTAGAGSGEALSSQPPLPQVAVRIPVG